MALISDHRAAFELYIRLSLEGRIIPTFRSDVVIDLGRQNWQKKMDALTEAPQRRFITYNAFIIISLPQFGPRCLTFDVDFSGNGGFECPDNGGDWRFCTHIVIK